MSILFCILYDFSDITIKINEIIIEAIIHSYMKNIMLGANICFAISNKTPTAKSNTFKEILYVFWWGVNIHKINILKTASFVNYQRL